MGAPTFIGVGMQKSGTRWLYEQLRHHPDVWMPPVKEFHFFTQRFPGPKVLREIAAGERLDSEADHDFARRVRALAERPGRPGLEDYAPLFEPAAGRLTGEITPAYAGLAEAEVARIARALPGTCAVVMVRDPVQRAWTALNDAVNAGSLDPGAVADPAAMIAALGEPRFAGTSYPSRAHERWSAHLPCGVFFLEDVAERPAESRRAVLAFLGADPDAPVALAPSHNSKAGRPRAPLGHALHAALAGHFAEELRRCARRLGGPALAWPARHGVAEAA